MVDTEPRVYCNPADIASRALGPNGIWKRIDAQNAAVKFLLNNNINPYSLDEHSYLRDTIRGFVVNNRAYGSKMKPEAVVFFVDHLSQLESAPAYEPVMRDRLTSALLEKYEDIVRSGLSLPGEEGEKAIIQADRVHELLVDLQTPTTVSYSTARRR